MAKMNYGRADTRASEVIVAEKIDCRFHLAATEMKRRKKVSDFQPDSEYIKNAVQEFIKGGGKIKKL